MNFFVVSAGKPGSEYIESNFQDILNSQEFALHPNTAQKGSYFSIERGDVLILKYNQHFVAYGIAIERYEHKKKEFSLRTKVEEWIFYDVDNTRSGVPRIGIQKATIVGGRYGTVKSVRPNFGIDKLRLINEAHPSFDNIYRSFKIDKKSLQKDGDYFEIHEILFNFLLDESEDNPEFTFVIRDSNNANNLDKGYWFYGEETVAISFWTGLDFTNKRPAISFLVNSNDYCRLVINTEVYKDLRKYLAQDSVMGIKLGLEQQGDVFTKVYNKYQINDYLNSLEEFLKSDYKAINRIIDLIEEEQTEEYQFNDSVIKKFPLKEFIFRLNNLFRYRKKNAPELELYSIEDEGKADTLNHISIRNYNLIKDEKLDFGNAKWVFITGENGSGKTMVLRAIATALGNRALLPKELKNSHISFEVSLETDGREIVFSRNNNASIRGKMNLISRGLAMYGPYRLQQTSNLVKDDTFRKALGKKGSFQSLFEDSSKLLSFDKQLELWTTSSRSKRNKQKIRMERVLSVLTRIIPDLRKIHFKRKNNNKYEFNYLVQSKGSEELMSLGWNDLSSGNKSTLNLVSDIIIRLFHQQPKVNDPSELRGMVLIDEIDLHLHPKAQRDLVITLSETFPLLQFIVTTHSPIPLLGAPKDSAIFVVKRDWEKGVYTERLKKLENELQYLTPNTLLTSKIFDMDFLSDKKRDEILQVYTEDNYDNILRNKTVEKNLRTLEKDALPKDLFK